MSDADGSWPADPTDPRCPACDGPVSATADYCMHCQADLPGADADSAASPPAAGSAQSAAAAGEATTATGEATTAAAQGTGSTSAAGRRGWLHPDGFLDNSLTVTVGVAVGAVLGALVTAALVFALPGGWPFLAGALAWALGTASIARSRTVFGAVQLSGYLLALVLVAIPLTVAGSSPMADPGASRAEFAMVLAIFAWPVAVVLAGIGWIFGRRASGDGSDG